MEASDSPHNGRIGGVCVSFPSVPADRISGERPGGRASWRRSGQPGLCGRIVLHRKRLSAVCSSVPPDRLCHPSQKDSRFHGGGLSALCPVDGHDDAAVGVCGLRFGRIAVGRVHRRDVSLGSGICAAGRKVYRPGCQRCDCRRHWHTVSGAELSADAGRLAGLACRSGFYRGVPVPLSRWRQLFRRPALPVRHGAPSAQAALRLERCRGFDVADYFAG